MDNSLAGAINALLPIITGGYTARAETETQGTPEGVAHG
jgi:hypothetical protein